MVNFKNVFRWHYPFLFVVLLLVSHLSAANTLLFSGDSLSAGYRVIAPCRKAEDVAQMRAQAFIGVTLDLNDAADEILALTDHRLFALFNNSGFDLYGLLRTALEV